MPLVRVSNGGSDPELILSASIASQQSGLTLSKSINNFTYLVFVMHPLDVATPSGSGGGSFLSVEWFKQNATSLEYTAGSNYGYSFKVQYMSEYRIWCQSVGVNRTLYIYGIK